MLLSTSPASPHVPQVPCHSAGEQLFFHAETCEESEANRDHCGEDFSICPVFWTLAQTLTYMHACSFLTVRIHLLTNKHPANTQSLHKPSLTFSPH